MATQILGARGMLGYLQEVSGPGWVLVWQPGPNTSLDLTDLETAKTKAHRSLGHLNREIEQEGNLVVKL